MDNLIVKCPKPPKDNKKRQKQVRFNERSIRVSQKESKNFDNDNNQKIYVSMEKISCDDKIFSKDYGNSSLLTNWILDSGAMCYMTLQVLNFIPGSL